MIGEIPTRKMATLMSAQPSAKRTFKLNQDFINPFVLATKDVFTKMVNLSPSAQAPILWKKPLPIGDVSSVMQLEGSRVTGQLAVSFQNGSLLQTASKMLMEEFCKIDDIVLDVAGEITNMITGGAKATLMENGFDFGMARPETYQERDYSGVTLVGAPRIIIPYQIDDGLFYIDLGFVES